MIYILPTAGEGKLIKSRSKKTTVAFGRRDTEQYWKTVRSCGNLLATTLEYLKFREFSLSTFILCFWRYKHDKRSLKKYTQKTVKLFSLRRTNPFATTPNSEAKFLETRLFDNVVKREQVSLLRKTKGDP